MPKNKARQYKEMGKITQNMNKNVTKENQTEILELEKKLIKKIQWKV